MSASLPPLPPEFEHDPRILKWRLDWHEARIATLEDQPGMIPSVSKPMLGRIALAAVLLLVGTYGHLPWLSAIGLKLLGG